MNSLGVFCDLNLKKSNDLMEIFDQALSKTNNLMETMENYNTYKKQEKNNINDEQEKINNNIQIRKSNKLKTYNSKRPSKFQLKPIKNYNKYYKIREPYSYQKEYEKDLINQIETLFNPNYKNNSKDNTGMLSFLSPLINSNLDERNKEFYRNKEKEKIKLIKEKEKYNSNDISNNKLKIKNNLISKKYKEKDEHKKTMDKTNNESNLKRKTLPKMNRQLYKAKTNLVPKNYYFKTNKNDNKSNIDLLINRLKKHYS